MTENSTPAPTLAPDAPATAPEGDSAPPSYPIGRLLALFALALVACFAAYLAFDVPSKWFPGTPTRAWGAKELTLSRGQGSVVGEDLAVTGADAASNVLVTVVTDFPARGYAGVSWIVGGLPEGADVHLFWRTSYRPDQLNTLPIRVEGGQATGTIVEGNPAWVGQITGLALAVRGSVAQPFLVRGVVVKPMGVVDVALDRLWEWGALEGWTGSSINTMVGGAEAQRLPLPLLVVGAMAVTLLVFAAWRRVHGRPLLPSLGIAFAILLLAGWALLDARWTANLARQLNVTLAEYGGKDAREKRLAAPDGGILQFVDKVRDTVPVGDGRVFVVGDVPYLRNRAAYHLYPRNVYVEPVQSTIPPASVMRKGDWIVVLQRKGMQYDRTNRRLRWEGEQSVPAELVLIDGGYVLLRVE